MNLFLKRKINPLLGAAGVLAVPNPTHFLLRHAMAPNVSGVIGSAIAAGILWRLMAKAI